MSENWNAVAADVLEAFSEVGFEATLVKPSTGPTTPYDNTPVAPGPTSTITLVRDTWTKRNVDGTLILQDDQFFLAPALPVPEKDDKLIVQGKTLRILWVRPTSPGATPVMHEIQAGKR